MHVLIPLVDQLVIFLLIKRVVHVPVVEEPLIVRCIRAGNEAIQVAEVAYVILLLLIRHACRCCRCLIRHFGIRDFLLVALEIDLIAVNVHAVEVFHILTFITIFAICSVVELGQHFRYLLQIRIVHLLSDGLRIRRTIAASESRSLSHGILHCKLPLLGV